MNKKTGTATFFLMTFLFVSAIDITGILIDNSQLQLISKPLIIPMLIAYYLAAAKYRNKWYLTALLFSFAGDVLLLDKNNLFLYGLGSFLLTQLLYIYIFSRDNGPISAIKIMKAFLPFLLFFAVLISMLGPGLQHFFIPVFLYGTAISVFGAVSLYKYLSGKNRVTLRLFAGAVLFILSDSMIALNKFHEPRSFYPVAIMITYITAQFLIAQYMIQSKSDH